MKIMHVCKKYPNALGGDAVVVSNLEKQQKFNGHQVIILTSNCNEIKNGSNIYKFGLKDTAASLDNITPRRIISLIMLYFKTFRVLKIERPDVIHTHSVDMAFFISFAARLYKIPIVHTFHIVTFYNENQPLVRRKTELFLVRGARAASITAPNAYDVIKLQEAGLKQSVLLPNGIDLSFWKKDPKVKKAVLFTFIIVGRLEKQKGIEYLIKAAAILREHCKTKFKILIVGEGSLKTQHESLAKSLNLEGCIKFLGKKDSFKVRKLYETSHAAVIPSLHEAMSLFLLEAWAMQLPVIATSVGNLKTTKESEIVISIPIQDEKALASAMLNLMTDKQLGLKTSINAYKEVSNLAWSTIASNVSEIYLKIVAVDLKNETSSIEHSI